MRRIALSYTLQAGDDAAASSPQALAPHPLVAVLDAVHDTGSISGAARRMGLSYRHVWGLLKRSEVQFGQPLVTWVRGQPARLAPAGTRLLHAERLAQARLAPQIDAVQHGIALAFDHAFGAPLPALAVCADHDTLLLQLRALASDQRCCTLHIGPGGGTAAMAALHDGRAGLAWLRTLAGADAQSATAQAWRPWLQSGAHRLVGVATRTVGLVVAPGNPLQITTLAGIARAGLRFIGPDTASDARLVLRNLLQAGHLDPAVWLASTTTEPTPQAVAEAVAGGDADAGLGDEALARSRGLGFVPLAQERCGLVVAREHLAQPAVVALLGLLRAPAWSLAVEATAGAQPWHGGEVLTAAQLPAWWPQRK